MRRLSQKRLEMSRRETLRRMHEQYGTIDGTVQPTPMGLSLAIQHAVSWVEHVSWSTLDDKPLLAIARLRLPRWTWIALGVLHFIALRRARAVIERYKAAGTMILVSVG